MGPRRSRTRLDRSTLVLLASLTAATSAHAKQDHTNLDETKVGTYTLPPLLGEPPVKTAAQWTAKRRPAILRLYQDNVHGHTPAVVPRDLSWKVVEEDAHALGGLARRK